MNRNEKWEVNKVLRVSELRRRTLFVSLAVNVILAVLLFIKDYA